MLQKHIPLKMIDLDLRVREALYARLSPEQLRAVSAGETGATTQRNSVLSRSPEQLRAISAGGKLDLLQLLVSIAYDVTPRIAYPQTPREVVIQLAELALDCPDLLTRLPVYITASPDRQQALILNVPLKALYVNVLDCAIRFGLDEVERLAGLAAVPSEWAHTLLWAMEKAYVEEGERGGFWMRAVLQCLALPTSWEAEREAREHVLAELLDLGLIKLRGSRAEIYDLALEVKAPLVKKYRLWEKWDEYDRDKEAIALASSGQTKYSEVSNPGLGGNSSLMPEVTVLQPREGEAQLTIDEIVTLSAEERRGIEKLAGALRYLNRLQRQFAAALNRGDYSIGHDASRLAAFVDQFGLSFNDDPIMRCWTLISDEEVERDAHDSDDEEKDH